MLDTIRYEILEDAVPRQPKLLGSCLWSRGSHEAHRGPCSERPILRLLPVLQSGGQAYKTFAS